MPPAPAPIEARAKVGGGDASVAGTFGLDGFALKDFRLTVQGRRVTLRYPEDLRLVVDADLVATGGPSGNLVRGEVVLQRGTYSRDFDLTLTDLLAKSRPTGAAAREPWKDRTRLEIHVVSSRALEVRNNLARLTGTVDLAGARHVSRIRRSSDRSRSTKAAASRSATCATRSSRARSTFASARGLAPILDVRARAEVRGYDIAVNVAGSWPRLETTFSSDPAAAGRRPRQPAADRRGARRLDDDGRLRHARLDGRLASSGAPRPASSRGPRRSSSSSSASRSTRSSRRAASPARRRPSASRSPELVRDLLAAALRGGQPRAGGGGRGPDLADLGPAPATRREQRLPDRPAAPDALVRLARGAAVPRRPVARLRRGGRRPAQAPADLYGRVVVSLSYASDGAVEKVGPFAAARDRGRERPDGDRDRADGAESLRNPAVRRRADRGDGGGRGRRRAGRPPACVSRSTRSSSPGSAGSRATSCAASCRIFAGSVYSADDVADGTEAIERRLLAEGFPQREGRRRKPSSIGDASTHG